MMKIGILQSAGIAGKIIDVALNHPEQEEVFTPIIYSKENGNDKNVAPDLKFGNIDGVVVAPGSATEFHFDGAMTLCTDGQRRLALAPAEDKDVFEAKCKLMWQSLKRDMLVSNPRIAIVQKAAGKAEAAAQQANADAAAQQNQPQQSQAQQGQAQQGQQTQQPSTADAPAADEPTGIAAYVKELCEQGVNVYGPYGMKTFVEQSMYQHFDAVLAADLEVMDQLKAMLLDDGHTRLLIGLPMVMAATSYLGDSLFNEEDLEAPAIALRSAVYTVADVCRNRRSYDEAHYNPLQKLYHERRDDGEKVRFAKKPFVPPTNN